MIGQGAKAGRAEGAVLLGLGLAIRCSAAWAGTLASPGCLDGGTPAIVAGVESPVDLRLGDGRLVRLAGIEANPADARTAEDARTRLAPWLVGRTVRVASLGTAPDRWGRTAALVFAADTASDDRAVSVVEALIEAGLAQARPSSAILPCWATYLRLENDARAAQRGLWADPAAGVIDAAGTPRLAARLGSFVIVEGILDSAHEGRARTYLRFAGTPKDGLAATIERHTLTRLGKVGVTPATWLHRRLRLRGVLDDRWGLQIEIATPEQVELTGP